MLADTYNHIYNRLEGVSVISTHEHHLKDEDQSNLTLEGIIEHSYVGWQQISFGKDRDGHRRFLEQARYNSYFTWLEKGLKDIYHFDGRISAENWEDISFLIKEKHKNPDSHLDILRDNCRYLAGLSDIYWSPGSDLGHPDLFKPVVRGDSFVTCFHPDIRDHDDRSPWEFYPIKGLTFGEYIDFIENLHRAEVSKGAVAFKLASAYERPIAVGNVSYDQAARIYLKKPEEVSVMEKHAYGDFIINKICTVAQDLGVPYQIHTGLGELQGSDPMLLEPLIERYPDIRFVLFHGGYPWYHSIGALAHNHGNISVDMVWLPLISTTAAISALHEYIEVVPSIERISWGSDTWTSEEARGALLAFQYVVASVLADKVDRGYISIDDALIIAEKFLYKNAAKIYKIELT
jgi:hypothetical protein